MRKRYYIEKNAKLIAGFQTEKAVLNKLNNIAYNPEVDMIYVLDTSTDDYIAVEDFITEHS